MEDYISLAIFKQELIKIKDENPDWDISIEDKTEDQLYFLYERSLERIRKDERDHHRKLFNAARMCLLVYILTPRGYEIDYGPPKSHYESEKRQSDLIQKYNIKHTDTRGTLFDGIFSMDLFEDLYVIDEREKDRLENKTLTPVINQLKTLPCKY